MKISSVFFLAFLFITANVLAQKTKFPEWDANPVMHTIPAQYAKEQALFILQDVNMDYRYEGRDIWVYYTLHRIIKVMDERGIESFNKIEIPVYHGTKLTSVKARTILPNGKVHDIAEDVMKISRNEQGAPELVFAMEGVEKNAEIELLIKEMRPLSLFGSETFQYQVPVLNANFEMAYPKEMVFEEKGYNGFPDAHDTLANNRRHIRVSKSGIPALQDEKYSFYDRYRMRAEYRINYLSEDNEKTKLFTWDDLAKRLHENFYTATENEKKAVNKYLTFLGITNNSNELENIKKIEDGIKKNITLYNETGDDDDENLDSIITKKSATESGYVKLFAACFTQAGINHELGTTTDRKEHALDRQFENWGIMENYVFYFPAQNSFLSPASVYIRYPLLPPEILGNKGLFCTMPASGKFTGPLSEIRTITPLPYNESQDNITANVSFTKEMDPLVDITYTSSGYSTLALRTALALKNNKRKELAEDVITIAANKESIVKYTIANEGFENYYTNKPLEISATVKADQLVEKAGSKYLFKIGDIIGKQSELYKAEDRKLPVDIPYPHSLHRTITINIPQGYKILNPETIKLHADYTSDDGKPVMGFNSDYKVNGNKLIVTIYEYYTQLHFHVNEYENYRKIINTAADFNKKALLLSK